MTRFPVASRWMRLAALLAAATPGLRAAGPDGEEIAYQVIATPDAAPERLRAALRQHWKTLPEGTSVRIGIGQVFDFGHGASSNNLEPALRSFVPVDAEGRPHGTELVLSMAGRGEGRTVAATIPWRHGVREGVEQQFQEEEGRRFVAVELPWRNGVLEGVRKTFHATGAMRSETAYRGGVPDGPSKTYGDDGTLLREAHMKAGKRHGDLKDYWPGGTQVKKLVPYRDGLVHGTVREYYKDGTPKRETGFRNDRLHGEDKLFTADGAPQSTARWREGEREDSPQPTRSPPDRLTE